MNELRRNRLTQMLNSEAVGRVASVPDKPQSQAPAVIIRGRNAKSNAYIDILTDGNDTDYDVPQKGGLLRVDAYPALYDEGTDTWNRTRGNYSEQIFGLGVYNGRQDTKRMDNFNSRGCHLIVNVTAIGAFTLTPSIWANDPLTGINYNLLVGLPIAATGITVIKLYPGLAPIPNAVANDILPRYFGVTIVPSAVGNATYSATLSQVI